MAEFIKIVYGDAPGGALVRNTDKVCIIGTTTTFSGLINNLNDASTLIDGTSYPGIVVTDPLYIAAKDFLANAGGAADLVLYAVPSAESWELNVELLGESLAWYVPYSPVSGSTGQEMYVGNQHSGIAAGYAGGHIPTTGWWTITTGLIKTESEGVWNGAFTIHSTGVSVSGVAGEFTGLLMTGEDRMRVDILKDPLSDAFRTLVAPAIAFQFFAFAYDPSDSSPAAPGEGDDFKYASGNCYSGKSWLKDFYMGKSMADQFNGQGQRTMFIHSKPEKMKPNAIITNTYAADTSFSGATAVNIKYEELKTSVGTDKYICIAGSKQNADSNAIDPAIDLMAKKMAIPARDTLLYTPTSIGQTDFPDNAEATALRNAQLNEAMYIKGLVGTRWGGNYTFGNGLDADFNYIQCKNLLAYKIETALYALVETKLHYSLKDVRKIKNTIISTLNAAVEVDKIIDGVGTVTIPIEDFLAKESVLSVTDLAYLNAQRATKIVSNIEIKYKWENDIEKIVISTFIGA